MAVDRAGPLSYILRAGLTPLLVSVPASPP